MLKDEELEVIEQEYYKKNMILEQFGEWVDAETLYEDIYGDLEQVVPVVFIDEDEDTKHMVKMSVDEAIDQAADRNDILLGGSTYFKNFVSKATAKDVHALIIDMDNVWAGVLQSALQNDWNEDDKELPKPTYIVNSGTGLHLYFLFDEPIPHYVCNSEKIDQLYRRLAVQQTTSRIYLQKQVQWFGQDFRMAGSLNKYNWRNEVFRVGEKWDIDRLAQAVGMEDTHFVRYGEPRTRQPVKRERIKNRTKRKGWRCNQGFYDYTLERCRNETKEGNRYMSFCALTVIAWKCNVPISKVEQDLKGLIPKYNKGAKRQITEKEIEHALRMYNEKAMLTQRERLQDWIGWEYKPQTNRHYGKQVFKRKKSQEARDKGLKNTNLEVRGWAVRDAMYPDGEWRNKDGAPSKQEEVRAWRQLHPDGKPKDCMADTGISKNTVYRWWNT